MSITIPATDGGNYEGESLMEDKVFEDSCRESFATAAWEAFDHWLIRHHLDHPDDKRSDLELIDVYYLECLKES